MRNKRTQHDIVLRLLKEKWESVEDKEKAWMPSYQFIKVNTQWGNMGTEGKRRAQELWEDENYQTSAYGHSVIDKEQIGKFIYFRWSPEKWEKHIELQRSELQNKLVVGYK